MIGYLSPYRRFAYGRNTRTHTYTYTRTHTHTRSPTHAHTQTNTHTHTRTLTNARTHAHARRHPAVIMVLMAPPQHSCCSLLHSCCSLFQPVAILLQTAFELQFTLQHFVLTTHGVYHVLYSDKRLQIRYQTECSV